MNKVLMVFMMSEAQSFKWLLSQTGGRAVRLQVHSRRRRVRGAVYSTGEKPVPSWEPSHNG